VDENIKTHQACLFGFLVFRHQGFLALTVVFAERKLERTTKVSLPGSTTLKNTQQIKW